jgi:hypothetical protein
MHIATRKLRGKGCAPTVAMCRKGDQAHFQALDSAPHKPFYSSAQELFTRFAQPRGIIFCPPSSAG